MRDRWPFSHLNIWMRSPVIFSSCSHFNSSHLYFLSLCKSGSNMKVRISRNGLNGIAGDDLFSSCTPCKLFISPDQQTLLLPPSPSTMNYLPTPLSAYPIISLTLKSRMPIGFGTACLCRTPSNLSVFSALHSVQQNGGNDRNPISWSPKVNSPFPDLAAYNSAVPASRLKSS